MNCFKALPVAAVLSVAPELQAQFNVLGQAQGFAYSNQNNFLTMNTSSGSFALTDGAINVSTRLTSKLRVRPQGYVRNFGQLGHGHVTLDWAYADYKVNEWLGVRAGRIKTVLVLYNDTQDEEFLYTWAILPQSLYPLDLRASTIANDGGDLYSEIPLPKSGSLSYTAYAGNRHFIDGYGDLYSAHGFCLRSNPGGKPTTNTLVLRTAFTF